MNRIVYGQYFLILTINYFFEISLALNKNLYKNVYHLEKREDLL